MLSTIIDNDQFLYVKERTMFYAVRTMDDVVEFCKVRSLNGILSAIDFEKAFDSLNRQFLKLLVVG